MEKHYAKSLKLAYIRPTLCPHISGTKCDRHKLIFSAERGGQSDLVAPYNRDQMGSTITETRVITAEPSQPCLSMRVPPSHMKGPCISKERLHNSLI